MSEFEIAWPQDGLGILVTQFAGLKIDEYVREVRRLVDDAAGPDEVHAYVEQTYPEISDRLRRKISLLVCGITPPDDLADEDVVRLAARDERTLDVEMATSSHPFEAGDVIYMQGKRWVVGTRNGACMLLKRF